MEDVAKANGSGLRWLSLMLTLSDDLIKEHVVQAEKSGYKALVITVDQPNVLIPRDNAHVFDMELTTFALLKIPPNVPVIKHVISNCLSFPITWERIEWVQTLTSLPIVLKGILTAEDAIEAMKHNIRAIVVSNHGGRQLDCVPATVRLIVYMRLSVAKPCILCQII
jgi:(S)-2-hydroxy-acid oxidase